MRLGVDDDDDDDKYVCYVCVGRRVLCACRCVVAGRVLASSQRVSSLRSGVLLRGVRCTCPCGVVRPARVYCYCIVLFVTTTVLPDALSC